MSPRVVIDHAGYDLLNLGDLSMLLTTVQQIRTRWPSADIAVGVNRIPTMGVPTLGSVRLVEVGNGPLTRMLPESRRWIAHRSVRRWGASQPLRTLHPGARSLAQLVDSADAVIAAGGGYVCDAFDSHAHGVLDSLERGQAAGARTAMFGQGFGPITKPALKKKLARVLPKLDVLTLRSQASNDLACRLAHVPSATMATGDDAFLWRPPAVPVPESGRRHLAVNLREIHYSGAATSTFASIGKIAVEECARLGVETHFVPVSWRSGGEDLRTVRKYIPGVQFTCGLGAHSGPEQIVTALHASRAVLTSSYHAAIFGLAQGLPTVALASNEYYALKFNGIKDFIPHNALKVIDTSSSNWQQDLSAALRVALTAPVVPVAEVLEATSAIRKNSSEYYERFFDLIDAAPEEGRR